VDSEGYAIGIAVAGSPSGGTFLAPIQDVLDTFGIQLVFSGQHLFTLSEAGPILSTEWLPDGVRIVTGGQDGVAHLWNVPNRDEEAVLYGHADAITSIAVAPDGHWLVTGSEDATAQVWDLTSPDPTSDPTTLRGHDRGITAVATDPEGRWLITGSKDTTVRLWDLNTPGKVSAPIVLYGHESSVTTVGISPDARRLAAGSTGTVLVWNLTNLDAEPTALHSEGATIIDVHFQADGSLLTTGADAHAISWNMSSGEKLAEFQWPIETEQINSITWSPDETQIVIVTPDGLATVCDAVGKKSLFTLVGYSDVLHAAWSPNGIRIATAGRDGTIRVWQGR
jgi:WD40 repeat protein